MFSVQPPQKRFALHVDKIFVTVCHLTWFSFKLELMGEMEDQCLMKILLYKEWTDW